MAYLIGADIGTTSLKAGLFSEELAPVAMVQREYPTHYPQDGRAEQNPEQWYNAFCACVRSLLLMAEAKPEQVAGVAVDGMSSLALPVDAAGAPLAPGMIWLDRRAAAQSDAIRDAHQDEQLRINGNRSDASNFAPKLMWLKERRLELYNAADKFLHCNAYLVFRLTDVFSMDVSQCGLSQICDIRTGGYSSELIARYGLDANKLPDIFPCSEVVGRITGAAAKETGLLEGTPVVAGAMDNVAATVGLGLRNAGDAYISAGTATNVGVLCDSPPMDGKGLVYHYGAPNMWLVNGGADYGASGLHWFRNILGHEDYTQLNAWEAETAPGEAPLLFLPYLVGQRAPLWNADACGAFVGVRPDVSQKHLVRGIMEGVALGARHVFSQLVEAPPATAAVTGGVANNARWLQIMANATGIRLRAAANQDAAPLGSAILAGVGVGMFSSFEAAFDLAPAVREYAPAAEHADFYNEMFDVFIETYRGLSSSLGKLADLRKKYGATAC